METLVKVGYLIDGNRRWGSPDMSNMDILEQDLQG